MARAGSDQQPVLHMLLHQCNTLAQAGRRTFGNPGDWPQDELETYLYYRNRYFYDEADAPC